MNSSYQPSFVRELSHPAATTITFIRDPLADLATESDCLCDTIPLLGDNCREMMHSILVGEAKSKLDTLKAHSSPESYGDKIMEIYNELAHSHSPLMASEVFALLKTQNGLHQEYLKVLTDPTNWSKPGQLELLMAELDRAEQPIQEQPEDWQANEKMFERIPEWLESVLRDWEGSPACENWEMADWDGQMSVDDDSDAESDCSEDCFDGLVMVSSRATSVSSTSVCELGQLPSLAY